jgi:hypothetical protein
MYVSFRQLRTSHPAGRGRLGAKSRLTTTQQSSEPFDYLVRMSRIAIDALDAAMMVVSFARQATGPRTSCNQKDHFAHLITLCRVTMLTTAYLCKSKKIIECFQ